jgi:hypothetical protein
MIKAGYDRLQIVSQIDQAAADRGVEPIPAINSRSLIKYTL